MDNKKKIDLVYLVGFLVIAILVGKENIPIQDQKLQTIGHMNKPTNATNVTSGTVGARVTPTSFPTPTTITLPIKEEPAKSDFNNDDAQAEPNSATVLVQSVKQVTGSVEVFKDKPAAVPPIEPTPIPNKKVTKSNSKADIQPVKTVRRPKKEVTRGMNQLVILGFEGCPNCRVLHQDLEQIDLTGFRLKDIDVEEVSVKGTKYGKYKEFPVIIIENSVGESLFTMVGYDRKKKIEAGVTYQQKLLQVVRYYEKRGK